MSIGGWNYALETGAEPPTPEETQEEYEQELTQTVLEDIEGERMRQREKWGNDHDDRHTTDDWTDIIQQQLYPFNQFMPTDKCRKQFVRIAAVAVAAVESMDRASAREQAEHASDEPPADFGIPF